MWCPTCRADVAAELSADERCFACTRCSTELGSAAVASRRGTHPTSRDAADLLARWSAEEFLPLTSSRHPDLTASATLSVTDDARLDTLIDKSPESIEPARPTARRRRVEPAQHSTSSWVASAAQVAAYAGVLLLTCGTVLVISSHYGASPQRAISGWLLAAVGQMMLFLGVITMVSHGLDQSQAEISRGVKRLSRRLRRLERLAVRNQDSRTDRRAA